MNDYLKTLGHIRLAYFAHQNYLSRDTNLHKIMHHNKMLLKVCSEIAGLIPNF